MSKRYEAVTPSSCGIRNLVTKHYLTNLEVASLLNERVDLLNEREGLEERNKQLRGIVSVLAYELAGYKGSTEPQCVRWAEEIERNSEERKLRESEAQP